MLGICLLWTSGLRSCWQLARVRPGAWNLGAVDLWVEVLLEAVVRPGAWNLLAVDLWVDVLLEARGAAWSWEDNRGKVCNKGDMGF